LFNKTRESNEGPLGLCICRALRYTLTDSDGTGQSLGLYAYFAYKKLVAKDGKVFKNAAFMVSCSAQSRDLFYNESTWPEGAELRDWVFYDKKSD